MLQQNKRCFYYIPSLKVLGYTYFEDPFMTSPQRQRIERQENYEVMLYRKDFLLFDDDEVRKAIFEKLVKDQFTREIEGKHFKTFT